MSEQRRFIRIPQDLPISYEILPNTESKESITQDIGQGGIKFFSRKPVPKYSLLKIGISLKEESLYFEAMVRVAWVRPDACSDRYEIGAEFIHLSKQSGRQIDDYINRILKRDNQRRIKKIAKE